MYMSTNTNTNKNANELGALWKKKSKAGMSFLSGYINDTDGKRTDVVVFANSNKSNERAPDYRLYLSKPIGEKTNPTNTNPTNTNNKIKEAKKVREVLEEEDSIL